jgi:hypothetical protein
MVEDKRAIKIVIDPRWSYNIEGVYASIPITSGLHMQTLEEFIGGDTWKQFLSANFDYLQEVTPTDTEQPDTFKFGKMHTRLTLKGYIEIKTSLIKVPHAKRAVTRNHWAIISRNGLQAYAYAAFKKFCVDLKIPRHRGLLLFLDRVEVIYSPV